MKRTARPISNPMVVLRMQPGGRAFLLHPDTGHAVGTNPVGVAVWKRLDGRHSLEEIVAEVGRLFDGVSDNVLEEMRAFVDQLTEEGFVGYEVT